MLFNGIEHRLVGSTVDITVIAAGRGVKFNSHFNRTHGKGRWRKLKGIATVQDVDGNTGRAELRW
jgi:hypothetical protein